jgi:serine/threonine-protein kinase ULK/ATG1
MSTTGEVIGIYTIGPEIGKGSFAVVYKCINNNTHRNVAIKSIVRSKLKSKKLIENLEIEISILKSMKHPHIVSLHDYHQTSTHFHLVMDYCSMGDLSYFIRKRNQLSKTHPIITSLLERYPSPEGSLGLNETLVIHFLQQLSSALQFLRDKSLVHRDIKPQNLLLCPPVHSNEEFLAANYVGLWELPILKIADFGFARFLPSTSMAETLCGSPLYMAPEILRFEKYNAKADLWSVGAVLYEMIVGKPPFKANNHIELLKTIEKTKDRIKFPSAAQVPEALKRLIKSLLKYSSTERISFSELFDDELITTPLESINMPLSTSKVDDNLYISEYISPLHKLDPTKDLDTNQIVHSKSNADKAREDEIKQIIHASSPGPEQPLESAQLGLGKSVGSRNKDDLILDKDYVVVEKRAVEVNAIADELARGSANNTGSQKRKSLAGADGSIYNVNTVNSNRQKQDGRRSSGSSNRRPSFTDRRISISISPSNALTKAIGIASNRLFGSSNATQDLIEESTNQNTFSTVVSSPNFANNLLLTKLTLPISTTIAQNFNNNNDYYVGKLTSDEIVLSKLESLATKAHAVNLFADVKFSQLIPSPPSSDGIDDLLHNNDFLPPKMVKTISEEGVALYVKTLSLLAKGMEVASEWWHNLDDAYDERSANYQTSIKINGLVQWIRERFNENLEKAEFIRLRLEEANTSILEDQNHSGSTTYIDPENFKKSRVMAEKLIFDRALEMSRNAAVNELVKEDLKGCELAYSTAIWMLESLLDEEKDSQPNDTLENEDKALIEKFIVSIGNRLSVLKKKLEML